ncbi:alpha-L-rhamnosidase [Jiangella alkaliphila]|uniref:alpha-L-rhamnosidase n=1 Tax=Jiangella alkaliphila TaxID=419479 RepID=A0A1H2IHS1_9ACTN|nr:alpha-L-rhamnosidase [Jiangella alkaliphila]SDU43689.1 alpha-L-rhamnosidase [Jiangella alkaliphila]
MAGSAALATVPGAAAAATPATSGAALRPVRPTVEHATNPLGIDAPAPRFGWRLEGAGSGRAQRAYRVVVASRRSRLGDPDVWDSGRVESAEQSARVYAGPRLAARTRYHWAVRVWDERGRPGPWSAPAWFETGLFGADDWSADWIGTGIELAKPTSTLGPGGFGWVPLEPGHTLGQTFTTASPLAAVAVLLRGDGADEPDGGTGGGCRLSLRHDGPGGAHVADTVVDAVTGEAQGRLDLPEEAPPGRYYVELSEPTGTLDWQVGGGPDDYGDGAAFADGLEDPAAPDHWLYGLPPDPPADPLLRTEFDLPGRVASARLYLSGLGLAEAWVNGDRAGDAELSAPPTDYDLRTRYTTHDVTALLRRGRNALGIALGRGFFATRAADSDGSNLARWVDEPRLLAQLEVVLTDGRRVTVPSGPDWQVTEGPTTYDGVLTGETYDARIAARLGDWTEPGYDGAGWRPAVVVDGPGGRLVAHALDAVRATGEVRPAEVRRLDDGTLLYDFGRVLAGWVRISGRFAAGATVRALYSEKAGPSGRIETPSPGGVGNPSIVGRFNVDEYIAAGRGVETWQPSFTYKGFRYVEVSSDAEVDVLAVAVHSDLDDTMTLELDDPELQWIADAFRQTAINGLHGYPDNAPMYTKLAWTSSTYRATAAMLYQFGMAGVFGGWLDDIAAAQLPDGAVPVIAPFNPPWGGAVLTPSSTGVYPYLVRRYWLTYGDPTVPARHFDGVARYLDWLVAAVGDGPADDQFGDWYPPLHGAPQNPVPPERGEIAGTVYAIQSLRDGLALAELLGDGDRAAAWRADAERLTGVLTDRFLDAAAGVYATSRTEAGYRQASNALPLAFGLVPAEHVPAVAANLAADVEARDRHLDTGALGTGALPFALGDHGRADLAHAVLNRTSYPSYGYLRSLGATTFWESWEAGSRGHNDATLSLVVPWLVERAAGLEPLAPGWARFRVRPGAVPTLPGARIALDTVRGRVELAWEHRHGGRLAVDLTVPVNAVAEVVLPDGSTREVSSGRHRLSARS